MAAAGGARDGPTRFRVIPEANPGFGLYAPSGCHGYKIPLQLGLSGSPDDFPRTAPIALVTIAPAEAKKPAWLATVPAEITTMTGAGIRHALKPLGGDLAIVGLTNQWLQYVATEAEYALQLYEGASTLYGPHSADFLRYQFDCLQREIRSSGASRCKETATINLIAPFDPDPAPTVSRMPEEDAHGPLAVESPRCRPRYRDGDLGWEMSLEALPATFTSDRHLFRVNVVEAAQPYRLLDDDRGSSVEVREVDAEEGGAVGEAKGHESHGSRWRVRWSPYLSRKERDALCARGFRLSVRGRYLVESRACTCEPRQNGSP
jgi:hypothetical protein